MGYKYEIFKDRMHHRYCRKPRVAQKYEDAGYTVREFGAPASPPPSPTPTPDPEPEPEQEPEPEVEVRGDVQDAVDTECPYCGAVPGDSCVTGSGRETQPHKARREQAQA